MPEGLLGPAGALVLAFIVISGLVRLAMILWAEHLKADQDDRDQRNRAMDILADLADGTKRTAAALESKNRREELARRKSDP